MVSSATTDVPIAIDEKAKFSFLCFGHADPLGSANSSDSLPMLENTNAGRANKI